MARRTYAPNALEPVLSSGITGGSTSIPLDSVSGLTVPGYMVIDPDKIAKREYFKFESINGSSLETLTRGLAGSAGGAQAHDAGATVRSVLTSQALDDIFLDIIDLEADQHIKYTDAEAVAAVHTKYTDAEAAAKIAADDLYVQIADGGLVVARMHDAFSEDFSTRIRTETVELVIPGDWNTYDVEAWSCLAVVVAEEVTEFFMIVKQDIEGTLLGGNGREQEMRRQAGAIQRQHIVAVSGWAEGLTDTGSRTVTLHYEIEGTSSDITTHDRSIIAHAYRTS